MILLVLWLMLNTVGFANSPSVCVDHQCINIELVNTPEAMRKGLMNRTAINDNEGMLFQFDKNDFHHMWMKNMRFPIDMLWINKEGIIVTIKENVQPCQTDPCDIYTSTNQAAYVLELKSQQTRQLGWNEGDHVVFNRMDQQ